MHYEFITYFVLALRTIMHEASYYAYEMNDGGRRVQYQPKSFSMMGSRCLHPFQWRLKRNTDFIYVL